MYEIPLTSTHSKSKAALLLNARSGNPGINVRPKTAHASLKASTPKAVSVSTKSRPSIRKPDLKLHYRSHCSAFLMSKVAPEHALYLYKFFLQHRRKKCAQLTRSILLKYFKITIFVQKLGALSNSQIRRCIRVTVFRKSFSTAKQKVLTGIHRSDMAHQTTPPGPLLL